MIFQIESEIVVNHYNNNDNYKIFDIPESNSDLTVIYLSSNNIYFPNTESSFKKSIIDENRFEWTNLIYPNAKRHIFLRDIKKQWYLDGINKNLNTLDKIVNFLKENLISDKVILIGSSAGGHAACLIGSYLKAEKIYSFNGQKELNTLVEYRSSSDVDPLVFSYHNKKEYEDFFDLTNKLSSLKNLYYFCSINSNWDYEQYNHIKTLHCTKILFTSKRHGMPFLKTAINDLYNLDDKQLKSFANKTNNPIIFSYRVSGILNTIRGLYKNFKIFLKLNIKPKRNVNNQN